MADGYLTEAYSSEPFTVYFTSMLVAMLQLVGGVAGVMPSNRDEYIVFTVAIILGTIAFAAVQGVIVQVMTTGDPDEIHFKQQMDALNFMMRDQHVRLFSAHRTQHTDCTNAFTLSDTPLGSTHTLHQCPPSLSLTLTACLAVMCWCCRFLYPTDEW